MSSKLTLKYSTAYYKDPFLFTLYPLDDLVCALSEARAGCIRTRDAIEFEKRGGPCERHAVAAYAVDNFEMGMFCVCRSV